MIWLRTDFYRRQEYLFNCERSEYSLAFEFGEEEVSWAARDGGVNWLRFVQWSMQAPRATSTRIGKVRWPRQMVQHLSDISLSLPPSSPLSLARGSPWDGGRNVICLSCDVFLVLFCFPFASLCLCLLHSVFLFLSFFCFLCFFLSVSLFLFPCLFLSICLSFFHSFSLSFCLLSLSLFVALLPSPLSPLSLPLSSFLPLPSTQLYLSYKRYVNKQCVFLDVYEQTLIFLSLSVESIPCC